VNGETTSGTEIARTDKRMAGWMTALGFCGGLACFVSGHPGTAGGFALGAALGILNCLWLHRAASSILDAKDTKIPVTVLVKFCGRYPLVFAIVYACYRTGWIPFVAVLAGLFVQVGGLFAEVVFRLREGWRSSGNA